MIRVLQVMNNISISSGVSSVVMNFYRNIDREKIQFDFLVSNKREKSYEKEIKSYGGNIFYASNPLSLKTITKSCRYSKEFFKNNYKKYKAVHLHSPNISEMTIRYAWKFGIKNIIIHSHSSLFSLNKYKEYINSYLVKNITKYGDYFFSCSTEAAKFLYGKEFCKNNKVILLKNAIEPEKYAFDSSIRKEIKKKFDWEGKTVFSHLSNFSEIKNVKFLLPVIKKITNQRKDVRFLFIGEGITKPNIENFLKDEGIIQYCKFLGFTNNVNYYLNSVDYLLLPSIKEGLAVSLIEAQANGIKCFVSDSVSNEADIGGIEFLPLEKEKWAKKIMDCEMLEDREKQINSKKFESSDFNISNEVKKLEYFYLSLH